MDADVQGWLAWVMSENRDPAACMTPWTLQLAAAGPVPPLELRRSLDAAHGSLVARIASELDSSSVMGLALDAWTQPLGGEGDGSVVTAAVFAVLPPRDDSDAKPTQLRAWSPRPRRSILLGLSVSPFSGSTSKQGAMTDALLGLTSRVMDEFAIDVRQRVAFFVGDPDIMEGLEEELASGESSRPIPVISCANKLLRPVANKVVSRYPSSVHTDMTAVRAALFRALMLPRSVRQRVCALFPSLLDVLSTISVPMITYDEKNWEEVTKSVNKYWELHSAVSAILSAREDEEDMDSDALKQLVVPDELLERLEGPRKELNALVSVKNKLSLRAGEPLHLVHRLFDAVRGWIRGCGDAFSMEGTSDIEHGVALVLQGRERSLSVEEERAMALLKLNRGEDGGDSSEEEFNGLAMGRVALSFADAVILAAMAEGTRRTRYMDLRWIPSTAEDRELLFPPESSGGSVLSMSPLTVEMLAMLRYNRDLWSLDGVGGELGDNGGGGDGGDGSGDSGGDGNGGGKEKKKKKRTARASRGAVKRRRTDAIAH